MKRGVVAALAVAAAVIVAGGGAFVAAATTSADGQDAPRPSSSAVLPIPTPTSSDPFAADGLQDPSVPDADVDTGLPTRIAVPRIGVDSSLEHLGLGAAGELEPPVDFDLAGWYSAGVVPGRIGPAIIAGHVDSAAGPAVFARIGELAPGDEVLVTMSSGAVLTFVVSDATQSAKSAFPTSDVYSNVPRPELRLITCAGSFDRSIGHYTDNLIVFAALKE